MLYVHRADCERATQPYSSGGGGTIYPGTKLAHGYQHGRVAIRGQSSCECCFLKCIHFIYSHFYHMHSTRTIINYLVTVIVFSLAVFRFVESCHTQCPRVNDITARLSFLHTMQLKVNIPAKPMSTIPGRMMDKFSY